MNRRLLVSAAAAMLPGLIAFELATAGGGEHYAGCQYVVQSDTTCSGYTADEVRCVAGPGPCQQGTEISIEGNCKIHMVANGETCVTGDPGQP